MAALLISLVDFSRSFLFVDYVKPCLPPSYIAWEVGCDCDILFFLVGLKAAKENA